MQIHAGGMMQCCAVANDADLGDFIIDYCQKRERGEDSDVLNNAGLQALRKSLLTGNLRPMCRHCFFMDDKLITTEQLREIVRSYFALYFPEGTDIDKLDLVKTHAFTDIALGFTNRCNLSCVYCVQSTQAKINPYYRMDFPQEYCQATMDFFASQGIKVVRSCVEGEGTLYKGWYEVFSEFHRKYPHVKLWMTTNLSRRYTEKEIELMARYSKLDVSCDTLDPALYAKLRRNGRLELVLENLERVSAKIKELGIPGPRISLHAVVSDVTWPTLPELAEFAFSKGWLPVFGNYEERNNSLAYQEKICRPLSTLPEDEQLKARDFFLRMKDALERRGVDPIGEGYIQGGLLYNIDKNVTHNFNRFDPYDDNPLHEAFHAVYPHGEQGMHLDIVYDYDNIAYNGVLFSSPGQTLRLRGLKARHMVVREVSVFAEGRKSYKYDQTVLPGYRKTLKLENGVFEYTPSFGDGVAKVLLEVSEYW